MIHVDNVFTFLLSHTQDLLGLKYYHCIKASPTICQKCRKIIKIIAQSGRQGSFCFFFNSWLLSVQVPQGVNQWTLSRSFVQLFCCCAEKFVEDSQSTEKFLLTKSEREKYLPETKKGHKTEAFILS